MRCLEVRHSRQAARIVVAGIVDDGADGASRERLGRARSEGQQFSSSHGSNVSGARMTGAGSCTGATVSLVALVRIAEVSTTPPDWSPASDSLSFARPRTIQRSQSPANANNPPSLRPMKYGCGMARARRLRRIRWPASSSAG